MSWLFKVIQQSGGITPLRKSQIQPSHPAVETSIKVPGGINKQQ